MPLIGLAPRNEEVEEILVARMGEIRPLFKEVVDREWETGEGDIVVDLLKCVIRDADPNAADVVIMLETNPSLELEAKANSLRDALVEAWIGLGFGLSMTMELWLRFISGSWCCIANNAVLDKVDHV